MPEEKHAYKILVAIHKAKIILGDTGIDLRIISKLILNKYDKNERFIWLRIMKMAGCCERGNIPFGSTDRREFHDRISKYKYKESDQET
jgi:hypothetical protein